RGEIGQVKNVRMLALAENKLTEFPAEIGTLTELRALSVSGNRLAALPGELANLVNLTELDVSHNKKLTELPELSRLVALDDVRIGKTGIAQLPLWLAKLPKLRRIWVEGGGDTQGPPELSRREKLEVHRPHKEEDQDRP